METMLHTAGYPRCHAIIASLPQLMVHSWMSSLLVERMEQRAAQVQGRADLCGGDWERAFFITLARSFGFGKNGDAFEQWARQLPLAALAHHRDNREQVEAVFLGTAGLLTPEQAIHQREYAYLCHKYSLTMQMDASQWRYARMRPQLFPHRGILHLAAIYIDHRATLSRTVELAMHADPGEAVRDIRSELLASASTARLVVINAVVPTLWAYAAHTQRQELQDRAVALLEQLPAEDNYIMRQWRECGLKVATAADSQSLLHLKRTRCDTCDCLRCRFGHEYLKQK